MCGICCYSGVQAVDKTKFRWLLRENITRGKDSTGVFTLKRDKEKTKTLYKSLASAEFFINHPPLKEALSGAVALIGHTRWASVGSVTYDNAHPFAFGEGEDLVVGLHNGFIIPQLIEKHTKDFGFEKEFPVDSQLIFAYLSKKKGDYNCLSDIEGAITVAWMMPNKWGERIFLYKRTPRELHIGFTKEGVYASSEATPLHLIACDSVWPLGNNQLVVLHNGAVEDFLTLKPPRINSMPENASRGYWEYKVPKEEYEELVPELIKSYSGKGGNTKQQNFFEEVTEETSAFITSLNSESEFGILMTDIRNELEKLEAKPISVTDSTDSEILDAGECSLVVIKLVDSVHKGPLPGFTIIDRLVADAEGITTLTGLTVLKYEKRHCEKDHELIVYDPIDETQPYSFTIKPKEGRIVEVVLELPFPQTQKTQAADTEDFASAEFSVHLNRLGDHRFGLLLPPNAKDALRLVAGNANDDAVREEPESDDGSHTQGKTSGTGTPHETGDVATASKQVSRGPEVTSVLNKTEALAFLKLHGMRAKDYKTPRVAYALIRKAVADAWASPLKNIMTFTLVWDAALLFEAFKEKSPDTVDVDYIFGVAKCGKWLLQNRPYFYVKSGVKMAAENLQMEFIDDEIDSFLNSPRQLISLNQGVGVYV